MHHNMFKQGTAEIIFIFLITGFEYVYKTILNTFENFSVNVSYRQEESNISLMQLKIISRRM